MVEASHVVDVLENVSDLRHTQDKRQGFVFLWLNELCPGPFTVQGLLVKELNATECDSTGGTGPLIDIFTV